MPRALFIGRFQPFHQGHLIDIKNILKEYDEVLIAIGSSNERRTKENPFSYNERRSMIKAMLEKNKIKNYRIYPSPDLYNDKKWVDDIRKRLPVFDIVFSGNPWTLRCFRKHKYKVKRIKLIKGINSTKIREMMIKNQNWQKLVPKEVFDYIRKIKGVERIKKIYSKR